MGVSCPHVYDSGTAQRASPTSACNRLSEQKRTAPRAKAGRGSDVYGASPRDTKHVVTTASFGMEDTEALRKVATRPRHGCTPAWHSREITTGSNLQKRGSRRFLRGRCRQR